MRFFLVFSVVLVNVLDGIFLRIATNYKLNLVFIDVLQFIKDAFLLLTKKESLLALVFIGLSYSLNLSKFFLWGFIHKRYDLSGSYPIMALLYPMIYFVAIINGEAVLELHKCIGTICIMLGTVLANQSSKQEVVV